MSCSLFGPWRNRQWRGCLPVFTDSDEAIGQCMLISLWSLACDWLAGYENFLKTQRLFAKIAQGMIIWRLKIIFTDSLTETASSGYTAKKGENNSRTIIREDITLTTTIQYRTPGWESKAGGAQVTAKHTHTAGGVRGLISLIGLGG